MTKARFLRIIGVVRIISGKSNALCRSNHATIRIHTYLLRCYISTYIMQSNHLTDSTRMVTNGSNTASIVEKQQISVITLSNFDHEYFEKK